MVSHVVCHDCRYELVLDRPEIAADATEQHRQARDHDVEWAEVD